MEFADLPDIVKSALTNAVPGAAWNEVEASEYGYLAVCKVEGRGSAHASVNCASKPVVRLSMSELVLPKVVLDALQREFPGSQALFAYQRAGRDGPVDYEIVAQPPRDAALRRVVVRADGEEIIAAPRSEGREPVFSDAFRYLLDHGKYTSWASDCSAASLEGVLWLLGALAAETLPKLKPIGAYVDLTPWPRGELRPRFALDKILRVVAQRESFEAERMGDLILSAEKAWARECRKSVPFVVRRALGVALPEPISAAVTGIDKAVDGYRYSGAAKNGQTFAVTIAHDGASASVVKQIAESDLPRAVIEPLQARAPRTYASKTIWATGPAWHQVDGYRVAYLQRGGLRTLSVNSDGTEVKEEPR